MDMSDRKRFVARCVDLKLRRGYRYLGSLILDPSLYPTDTKDTKCSAKAHVPGIGNT